MCIWKNDYYNGCGHQPFYLQDICPRRTVIIDGHTKKRIIRACERLDISAVLTIEDICPECHLSHEVSRTALQQLPQQQQIPVPIPLPARYPSLRPSLYELQERPTMGPTQVASNTSVGNYVSNGPLAYGQWPVMSSSTYRPSSYGDSHQLPVPASTSPPHSHYIETPPPPYQSHGGSQSQSFDNGYFLHLPPPSNVVAPSNMYVRRPTGARRPEHSHQSSSPSLRSSEGYDILRRGNETIRMQRRNAIEGIRLDTERRGSTRIDERRAMAAAIEGASPRRKVKLSSVGRRETMDGGSRETDYQ